MKCAFLIIDGLGDLPVAALGGKTPLEAAHTPNLDSLASSGRYGLVDPIASGKMANTHSGVGMLLGLLPEHSSPLRRGTVEAAGLGLALKEGDVALRANFATMEETPGGLLIRDRRAGRIDRQTRELARLFENTDLDDNVTAHLFSTDQHRAVLVLSGPDLHDSISDTDPGDVPMPALVAECRPQDPVAQKTASTINRFISIAHLRLRDHPVNRGRLKRGALPANGIITRGAGSVSGFKSIITEMGLSAAVVSGCNTVLGLGLLLGFDVVSDPRFTASVDTDLEAKVDAVIRALDKHDIVYLHIKAPDLCAHDRQPGAKRNFLERLDAALGPLLVHDAIIAVTADHTTDSNTGFHTADPVPALLFDPGERQSNPTATFGERSCVQGNMDRQLSEEFLLKVIGALGFRPPGSRPI
jgi:2,3-bisphosphoglycerate-independent phosphoglycerate mutase